MKNGYLLLSAAFLFITGLTNAQDIVITEISYNPPESGTDSTEYIELYNNGSTTVDLSGYSFSQGITHTFPSGILINAGAYLVIAIDSVAVQNRFGIPLVYEWNSGALSNGGEDIVLVNASNVTIDSVDYDDGGLWPSGSSAMPASPDGFGTSLVLCDPSLDNNVGSNWYASNSNAGLVINGYAVYGSPSAADSVCLPAVSCPSSFSVSACNTYTVPSGDETYTMSGTYMDTIMGSGGCDSIMTITLTINNATSATDTQTACGSYMWINGITYTASNNTAMDTLINAAGCDSVVTLNLTINTVTDLTTGTSGATITANNTNATGYQWLDCDNGYAIISGETNQSYTATANGNYAVELTENGCVDTTTCAAITTIGISENDFGAEFKVYPNPTSGLVSFDLGSSYNSIQMSISDVSGKRILVKTFNQSQIVNLNLEAPKGIYMVRIQSGDKNATIRLIKD